MTPKLYVVHGSHPCAAVEKAAELKGLTLDKVELPPPAHALLTRVLGFPERTVPALKLDGGERVSGSRAILRRLDELRPEPPLLPADAGRRARVEEAERFDDDVLQPAARRILWTAFGRDGKALPSFQAGSKLPVPGRVAVAGAPLIARVELRLNPGSADAVAELRGLRANLDRIDGWIADGTLGGDPPTSADLKLGASVRLLSTLEDLRPVLEGRPCAELARRLYPEWAGRVPAGTISVPA